MVWTIPPFYFLRTPFRQQEVVDFLNEIIVEKKTNRMIHLQYQK